MHIDVTQPFPHKMPILDKLHHLFMFCVSCHGECAKEREYFISVLDISAGDFSDDKCMKDNMTFVQ